MAEVSAKGSSNAQSSKAKSIAHDAYCWICHNLKITVFCSTCPRSYHSLCVDNNQDGKNDWRCDCCLKLEKARSNWATWTFDSNSLKTAFNRVILEAKELKQVFNSESSKYENGNKLINPIDLSKIKKKVEANEYETPEEFYVDIKWVQHNISIIYPNNPKYDKMATELVVECDLELTALSHCTDCYERSEKRARGWFTAYCIPPHLVIWAKYSTYPYWPGKLMSADDKMVDVQFFGDHTFETVSVDNCFIYSEKHPEKETIEYTKEFKTAQEECQKYIKRLRARFGDFKYGKDGQKLDLKNINYHLENMIPKLKDELKSIDIQFKRMIPMEKSLVVDIDDELLSSSDSNSGTQWIINSEDSTNSDENEIKIVDSPKNPEHMVNESMDLELEMEAIFRSDESETVDDELDPLRMDSQSNDEMSKTDKPQPSSSDEGKGNSSSLNRNNFNKLHAKSKRMRLDGMECNHVNSSQRPESSWSCPSIFSQATIDFEFDKQKIADETAATVVQPVPTVPKHDVVHSTQLTPPPNVATETVGLDIPIRAYIAALERLKEELWSQNKKYVEQLEIMQKEIMTLREENLRLIKQK